jgi:hypothetical protein
MLRGSVLAVLICAVGGSAPAVAQQVRAVRVRGSAMRLDGRLSEAVWRAAPPATGFLQRDPNEGDPAPEATEVRFAFDEDALWIAARMHSADPASIRAFVTRRDREASSEQLIVSLDTQRDRRTAYSFGVTPAAVRIDYFHGGDEEDWRDYGFDPVWEVATAIDSLGWTAEMRIPFTQLRFNPAVEQLWGLNVTRRVPARNEASYWVLVRRNETGWSSRMGALSGIREVAPSRRLELLPYVATDARLTSEVNRSNPFARRHETDARVGADAKLGLGPSVTVDATINPDFGQVEADPAQVNLTAYEIFFDERRPFFTEGAELLSGRGMFYSRRIGAPPPGDADADFAQRRDNTTILGAAKLAGRLPSRLSVAALAAVTGRERVQTFDTTTRAFGRATVAPLTGYMVASAQQELGRDNSTVRALVTSVQRDVPDASPLADVVARAAYSGMLEGRWRWAGGKYDASSYVALTDVEGDPAALLGLQRSARRYWQRPDAEHVSIDPTRRSLRGTMFGINHSKMSGRHWLWDVDYQQTSPGFEPNDIGAFGPVDERSLGATLRYRETQPGGWFQRLEAGVNHAADWNFEGIRREAELEGWFNSVLPNFWELNAGGGFGLRGMSDRLTRGGPLMATGQRWDFGLELQNADGARHRWDLEWAVEGGELGASEVNIEGGFSLRPGSRWELSLDPSWSHGVEPRQYVTSIPDGRAETFGRRYVFAHVEQHEIAARMRVNFTVTPNLTIESYLEPFGASGRYTRFGELRAARSREVREYGTDGTTATLDESGALHVVADGQTFTLEPEDFNVRSLRSNLVARWEWRPGSTLYLVWQQSLDADRDPARVRPDALLDAFRGRGDNFLALKVSYWIPVR